MNSQPNNMEINIHKIILKRIRNSKNEVTEVHHNIQQQKVNTVNIFILFLWHI